MSKRNREAGVAWLLASPATTLLITFYALPTLAIGAMSLTDWQFGAANANFIGLQNFAEIGNDPVFLSAIWNTIRFTLIVLPAVLLLGLSAALLVQARSQVASLLQAVHLLPYMATLAAMAFVWQALLHPTSGLFNTVLERVGLEPINWLRDPGTVLPTLAAITIWENFGYAAVLIFAGLKTIPSELNEAAAVDGLSTQVERFFTITLPLLGPTLAFVAVIVAIRAVSIFDTVAVLTQGGPAQASEVLLYRIYVEGFVYLRAGYGAALTVAFLLILTAPAVLRLRLSGGATVNEA